MGELVFSWRSYPSGNLDKPDNVTINSTDDAEVNEYYGHEAVYYRDRLKGGPEVGRFLLLLLLTTSAWPGLKHSRNLGTTF